MTVDIVVGYGEVGTAITAIFNERRTVLPHDPPKGIVANPEKEVDWLHVCIPYSPTFLSIVPSYIKQFKPHYVVIHSTVPVGTTRKIAEGTDIPVFYSPVRGRHPHLVHYLREFPKWFAGPDGDMASADLMETYCATSAMQTRRAPSYEFLELAKLWETTTQGYLLSMWHEIERETKQIPGDYLQNIEAMRIWLYEKRKVYDGDVGFVPILSNIPGPIGGHCIVANWDLQRPLMTPAFYEWLKESNEMRKTGLGT